MRYFVLLTCSIIALSIVSCENQGPTVVQPTNSNDIQIKMINCNDSLHVFTDPASIKEVTVSGDSLKFLVTYGGGCEKHEFALYGCTSFMESNPPQDEIFLSHNAHGDLCKALITETLTFDLGPLKALGKQGDQNLHTIILRIREPKADQPFKPYPRYEF